MTNKLAGKRIFITEDDSMNRVVYTMVLKVSGAVIEFDRTGRDTLSRLKDFHPDLIILDLMLRGDSGFILFEDIRRMGGFDKVPIVAISASDPSLAMQKCRNIGFNGFISKPIEEELLVDQLVHLIEGGEVWYSGGSYDYLLSHKP